MQVSHILTSTKELIGENINNLSEKNGHESHILALKIATIMNEAFVENPDEELQKLQVRGRPTDRALLMAGIQAGLDKYELEKQYKVLDKIIFNSEIKYAAGLF